MHQAVIPWPGNHAPRLAKCARSGGPANANDLNPLLGLRSQPADVAKTDRRGSGGTAGNADAIGQRMIAAKYGVDRQQGAALAAVIAANIKLITGMLGAA